jgi:hypothetical protein
MSHPRDRWANAWTHSEDSLLWEAVEITGNRDRRAWEYLRSLGVNRTFKAFCGRRYYLEQKQKELIRSQLPKGWGYV